MERKRYFQIDFAKTIGIFLVILGHVIFFNKELGLNYKLVNLCINSFHMPLFFIISGLHLGLSRTKVDKNPYKSLFKKLLLPYFIWSLLYNFIFALYLPYDFFGFDTIWEKLYSTIILHGISPLWFLSTLFLGQIVYKFITGFSFFKSYPKSSHFLLLLISFVSSILINKGFQPYPVTLDILYAYPLITLCRIVLVLFFLEIGYLLGLIWEKYIELKFVYRFLIFLTNILVLWLLKDRFIYNNVFSFFIIQDMKSFLATGITGSFLVISFSCLFNKEIGIVSAIGKRTMDIMALHIQPIPIAGVVTSILA